MEVQTLFQWVICHQQEVEQYHTPTKKIIRTHSTSRQQRTPQDELRLLVTVT